MTTKKRFHPSTMEDYIQERSSDYNTTKTQGMDLVKNLQQTRERTQPIEKSHSPHSPQTRAITKRVALHQTSPQTREMLKGILSQNKYSPKSEARKQLLSENRLKPHAQTQVQKQLFQPNVDNQPQRKPSLRPKTNKELQLPFPSTTKSISQIHMESNKQSQLQSSVNSKMPSQMFSIQGSQGTGQPQLTREQLQYLSQKGPQVQTKKQPQPQSMSQAQGQLRQQQGQSLVETEKHIQDSQLYSSSGTQLQGKKQPQPQSMSQVQRQLRRQQGQPLVETEEHMQQQFQPKSPRYSSPGSQLQIKKQPQPQSVSHVQRQLRQQQGQPSVETEELVQQFQPESPRYSSQRSQLKTKKQHQPLSMSQGQRQQQGQPSVETEEHMEQQFQPESPRYSSPDHSSVKKPTTNNRRGLAKGYKGWGEGEILTVEFNEYGQAVGSNASKFSSQLGVIARCGTRLPLNIISWAKMPKSYKDAVWEEIKENSNAMDIHKGPCMKRVGDLWKKWKAEVKKLYFTPYENNLEKLAEFPGDNRLRPDQWQKLVKYWQFDEVKAQAQANKGHRSGVRCVHRTGRTSFAYIRNDMRKSNQDVSRVSVFRKTREPPENKPRHEDTDRVLEKMKLQLDEVPESERTLEFEETVYESVLGPEKKHGRVRTFGIGPSLTDIFKPKSVPTSDHIQQLVDERVKMVLSEYEKEHKEKLEKLNDLEKQQVEKAEMLDSMLQSLKSKMISHGVDYEVTPSNPSSSGHGQVNTNGSVGLDNSEPSTPNSQTDAFDEEFE